MKLRAVRWARHVARIGTIRNVYPALVGRLELTTLLEIPGNNRQDNINMHLMFIGPCLILIVE